MAKSMPRPQGVPHRDHGMPVGGDAYEEAAEMQDTPAEARRKTDTRNAAGANNMSAPYYQQTEYAS